MMVVCLLCVVLFLTGHQGKQHHHAGGLGESMRAEEAPEENDPYIFFFFGFFFCLFVFYIIVPFWLLSKETKHLYLNCGMIDTVFLFGFLKCVIL